MPRLLPVGSLDISGEITARSNRFTFTTELEAIVGRLGRVEGRDRLPATGIIWDAEGLIVTSHHVLERDENIKVGFQDGESVAAELVGRDPSTDLALLRTSKQGLKAPE